MALLLPRDITLSPSVGSLVIVTIMNNQGENSFRRDVTDAKADSRPSDNDITCESTVWRKWTDNQRSAAVASHPVRSQCAIAECALCSMRDCPSHDAYHYIEYGCPSCAEAEFAAGF